MIKVKEIERCTPKPHIPETIELVLCDSCGARDWKIYSHDETYMSQDGDGCLHCDTGTLRKYKRFDSVGDQRLTELQIQDETIEIESMHTSLEARECPMPDAVKSRIDYYYEELMNPQEERDNDNT